MKIFRSKRNVFALCLAAILPFAWVSGADTTVTSLKGNKVTVQDANLIAIPGHDDILVVSPINQLPLNISPNVSFEEAPKWEWVETRPKPMEATFSSNNHEVKVEVDFETKAKKNNLDADDAETVIVRLLMLELEVEKDQLVLLEENTLSIEGKNNLPSGVLDSVKFEIKRDGETAWYEIQDGPKTEFTGKARVAGTFIVRATLDLSGTEVLTNEEEIEVKFPNPTEILSGSGVRARMDQAWADTKNATTSTSRREEGYWIALDTDGNGTYAISHHSTGPVVDNDTTASWSLPFRPADNPANPTPIEDGVVYSVGWFHTHTPMTYRIGSRLSGPSGPDQSAATNSNIDSPGFAYDYEVSVIPSGHPIDSSAKVYNITPPDRRTTP